jgi:hypothetical protein
MARFSHTVASFLVLLGAGLADIDTAHAWGGEGHRITGYVAESLLTPKARIRLHQITDGATLDQLATYMDEHRQDLGPRVRKWHYDNMPVCETVPVETYCHQGDCASQQIERLMGVLNNPGATQEQKRQSVVYLSHLIGDLHQPLHAGDHGDQGGNGVSVTSGRSRGHHHKNLHSEWDSTFVKSQVRGRSEEEFSAQLVREGQGRIEGFEHGSARDWLLESNRIARDFAYGQLPGFRCGEPLTTMAITGDYASGARQIVREQLLKAGARMAWVFNSALGQ